jgi:hypothetical protein
LKLHPRLICDGLLDVLVLKESGSLKMLNELASMKDDQYKEEGNMFYKKSRKVSFASKERDVTVTIDGEIIGILPATFEVIHNALTVCSSSCRYNRDQDQASDLTHDGGSVLAQSVLAYRLSAIHNHCLTINKRCIIACEHQGNTCNFFWLAGPSKWNRGYQLSFLFVC